MPNFIAARVFQIRRRGNTNWRAEVVFFITQRLIVLKKAG